LNLQSFLHICPLMVDIFDSRKTFVNKNHLIYHSYTYLGSGKLIVLECKAFYSFFLCLTIPWCGGLVGLSIDTKQLLSRGPSKELCCQFSIQIAQWFQKLRKLSKSFILIWLYVKLWYSVVASHFFI
jgi:hypothetical protein